MPGLDRGLFREKPLERLSSPERLDELLRLADRKSWLPLLALAILVCVLVAWAIFGEIQVNVHGRGILLRPREIAELQAPGPGYLTELNVRVDDIVVPGQELGKIARPDLEKQLELQRAKADELAEAGRGMLRMQRTSLHAWPGSADALLPENDIEASRVLARRLRDKELEAIGRERAILEEQVELARAHAESRRERLQAHVELRDSGVISEGELTDSEAAHMTSLAALTTLQMQVERMRTRELEIEEQCLSRLQRIADREQEIADVDREIQRLQSALDVEGRLVSEHHGRVLELSVVEGRFLTPGARIGSMAMTGAGPLTSLTYFTVRDGKRLERGMRIQITPDTVERERYGGIHGKILSISPFPVTLEEAEAVVGNRGLAETLISGGRRIQVFAELIDDDSTHSGLSWTSARGPDMTFSAGTTTTARSAIESRRPITFVLPILRSAAGTD